MLLLAGSWLLTLGLLVVVVRGPERWHRGVVLNVHPGRPEPTRSGYALLFWRHLALLVVAGSLAGVLTDRALGPSDEELAETTELVVDLVPDEELDADRLTAELALRAPTALVEDVSFDLPRPTTGGSLSVNVTYLQVRRLTWRQRLEEVPRADEAGPAVTCVTISIVSDGMTGDDPTNVSTDDGACEAE